MATKMKGISHDKLVKRAIRWLWSQGCAIVISEMASASQEPDAIGFLTNWTILIECKASRSDFLSEKHKPHVRSKTSMGDKRYYLTPPSIIKSGELPEGYGLLELYGNGVTIMEGAKFINDKDWRAEMHLLISAMRRIDGKPGKGTSVRFYNYQTGCRATLGVKKDCVA